MGEEGYSGRDGEAEYTGAGVEGWKSEMKEVRPTI